MSRNAVFGGAAPLTKLFSACYAENIIANLRSLACVGDAALRPPTPVCDTLPSHAQHD